MTGQQALDVLLSSTMEELLTKNRRTNKVEEKEADGSTRNSSEFPLLVDGRVGIISGGSNDPSDDEDGIINTESVRSYIKKLQNAGATGAIIGGGIANSVSASSDIQLLDYGQSE